MAKAVGNPVLSLAPSEGEPDGEEAELRPPVPLRLHQQLAQAEAAVPAV